MGYLLGTCIDPDLYQSFQRPTLGVRKGTNEENKASRVVDTIDYCFRLVYDLTILYPECVR